MGVWKRGSVDDKEGRWRSMECGARELVANSLMHSFFPRILGAKRNEDFQQSADYQTDTNQHGCFTEGDARSGPGMVEMNHKEESCK